MEKLLHSDFPNVTFGQNVEIFCDIAMLKDGARIGDNVKIHAEKISIGFDTIVENDTIVKAIGGQTMSLFEVGDNCLIGFKNQILVPVFEMRDYSQLHNSCLCSGYKPLLIGYNCWIGQGAILNSFENLTLGNNVRMGGSQIWTHVASGELLEGSNFYGAKEVVLEDDVWLMGFGHLVSPGVVIRKGSVVMAGSTVTKSTEEYRTYSGIPAVDISSKLPAWTKKKPEEKYKLMEQFIHEFCEVNPKYRDNVRILKKTGVFEGQLDRLLQKTEPQLIIIEEINFPFPDSIHTIIDLKSKRYTKRRSQIEIQFIKFNLGFRARFIPFVK